jgi:hypothetical protein
VASWIVDVDVKLRLSRVVGVEGVDLKRLERLGFYAVVTLIKIFRLRAVDGNEIKR